MYVTLTGLLMPFVGFNMEGAIARKFYSDKEIIKRYVGNCILVSGINLLIVFAICLIFHSTIFNYTGLIKKWVLLAVIQCFFQFVVMVFLTMNLVKVKPVNYGIIQIVQSILNLGLSLALIIYCDLGWEGRLIAAFLSSLSVGIVVLSILAFNGYIEFSLNINYVKHAISYGGGLIPHTLGSFFLIYTNRFFLLKMVSLNETGLYSAASQVASIMGFMTASFNNAFVPWLYERLNQNNEYVKKRIVKLTYSYFVIIGVLGLLFYFSVPIAYRILISHNFDDSSKYIFWIILGLVFQGMYFMVTNYITYAEKTWYQAIVTVCVALINIPLNYFCITIFGPVGAAMAFCIAFFLLFIGTWALSAKVYNMPW